MRLAVAARSKLGKELVQLLRAYSGISHLSARAFGLAKSIVSMIAAFTAFLGATSFITNHEFIGALFLFLSFIATLLRGTDDLLKSIVEDLLCWSLRNDERRPPRAS